MPADGPLKYYRPFQRGGMRSGQGAVLPQRPAVEWADPHRVGHATFYGFIRNQRRPVTVT